MDVASERARFQAEALDHESKVRVPFPAVGPADALDWLLSIVVPAWEPAPWTDVVAAPPKR